MTATIKTTTIDDQGVTIIEFPFRDLPGDGISWAVQTYDPDDDAHLTWTLAVGQELTSLGTTRWRWSVVCHGSDREWAGTERTRNLGMYAAQAALVELVEAPKLADAQANAEASLRHDLEASREETRRLRQQLQEALSRPLGGQPDHEMERVPTISERLNRVLSEMGISKSQIARELGVSPTAVTYWGRGTAVPTGRRSTAIQHWLAEKEAELAEQEELDVGKLLDDQ